MSGRMRTPVLVFSAIGLAAFALVAVAMALQPSWTTAVLQKVTPLGFAALLCALMAWWDPNGERDMPAPLINRFYRDAMPALAVYLAFSMFRRELFALTDVTWMRACIALVPGICIAMMLRGMLRFVRDSDELQRRIELEAIAIAAMLVSIVYTSTGFLQLAGLLQVPPRTALEGMFPLLSVLYVCIRMLIARRYR